MKISKFEMFLNERLGINEDVEILSEFLIHKLKDCEQGDFYIFYNKDLPQLTEKIHKIIINYKVPREDSDVYAFFEPNESKKTSNGFILCFTFYRLYPQFIYHEVQHAFQFIKKGKYYTFTGDDIAIEQVSKYFNYEPYSSFYWVMYQIQDNEIESYVNQLYGKLKYASDVRSSEDLRHKFITKKTEEFNILDYLKNFNIFKHFKDCKEEHLKLFFSVLKEITHQINISKSPLEIKRTLTRMSKKLEVKPISDKKLRKIMKSYQNKIDKQTRKLDYNLDRLRSKLEDFYKIKYGE